MNHHLRAGEQHQLQADVLVIGAGTVGLIAAVKLAEQGFSVICLESGSDKQEADEHPLNAVVHTKLTYEGAAHGRFRCFGGTSTRWGGALIPFMQADLESAQWPVSHAELAPYVAQAEELFGLREGPYDAGTLGGLASADFIPRLAKWPPFAKRNVAYLLRDRIAALPHLQIWLDATATQFDVRDGKLERVVARSNDGGQLEVRAREVIFAAGAIETTRLLLLLDQQNDHAVFGPDDQLGRYFSDHLSTVVAHLEPHNTKELNRLAGYRFEPQGAMRNLRFMMTNESPLRHTVPPCFAHIAFESSDGSGFSVLRDVYRSLQQRRVPPWQALVGLALAAPWLVRAVWWRFVEKRLLYPDDADIQLHMVIEQLPRPECRITLSPQRNDPFGLPLAEIAWDIAAQDHDNIHHAVAAFQTAWDGSTLASLARVVPLPTEQVSTDLSKSGGIYHPVGSTRMGHAPDSAVVDARLRPFRLRNTSVLSTSVLPSSGGAEPTMMLVLLGLRCIDQLTQSLRAA